MSKKSFTKEKKGREEEWTWENSGVSFNGYKYIKKTTIQRI